MKSCVGFVVLIVSFLFIIACGGAASTASSGSTKVAALTADANATATAKMVQSTAEAISTENAFAIATITAGAIQSQSAAAPQPTSVPSAAPTEEPLNSPVPLSLPTATTYYVVVTSVPTATPRPTAIFAFVATTKRIGPIRETARDELFSVELILTRIAWDRGAHDLLPPKRGNIYLIAYVHVHNLGPGTIHSLYTTDFQVKDVNGAVRNETYVSAARDCGLDLVDLAANSSIDGCVSFEVPAQGSLEFIYAPFLYEGLKPGRYLSFPIRH